jgi:pimeloyl-ACP methyl ester carboxylesterase
MLQQFSPGIPKHVRIVTYAGQPVAASVDLTGSSTELRFAKGSYRMRYVAALVLGLGICLVGGCASPTNPSFPVTSNQANQAIAQMRANPVALQRPLVIIGGFADFNVSPPLFDNFFKGLTRDSRIIPVSVGLCGNFADCRQTVIDAVQKACPSDDPNWTTEVDVVGASLGGLVGRYAAVPSRDPAHPRRLRVARLFTISSPLSGATLANAIALTQFHRDIKPGSPFLKALAASDAEARYQTYSYVHLGDEIVGQQYAALPGHTPYWLANDSLLLPHPAAMMDSRILADIARHLRNEPTFSRPPPAPLPGDVTKPRSLTEPEEVIVLR